jgi:hypothetical protein
MVLLIGTHRVPGALFQCPASLRQAGDRNTARSNLLMQFASHSYCFMHLPMYRISASSRMVQFYLYRYGVLVVLQRQAWAALA